MRSLLILIILSSSACSYQQVRPWERGDLARPDMEWDSGLVDEAVILDHIHVSKEATSLGSAVAGGGCGCN